MTSPKNIIIALMIAAFNVAQAQPQVIRDRVFQTPVSLEGEVTAEGCLFMGKLYLSSWSEFTLRNCIFLSGLEIGGMAQDGRITNNTFVGSDGAGVSLMAFASVTLMNNIITGNRTGIDNYGRGDLLIEYCDVYDNRTAYENCSPGEGCLAVDPIFVDREAGDYRLEPGSPCIDRGSPDLTDPDGSRSDMGALPYLRNPEVIFDLLLPTDNSEVGGQSVLLSWEPLRYGMYYMVTLMNRGFLVSYSTPYSVLALGLDTAGIDARSGDRIEWWVDAVVFGDTVASRQHYSFIPTSLSVPGERLAVESFALSSFPNPFNSSTTISYSLPKPGRYALDVIDLQGRLVTRLSDGWREAGSYREVWDGKTSSTGSYFVELRSNDNSFHKLIEILR